MPVPFSLFIALVSSSSEGRDNLRTHRKPRISIEHKTSVWERTVGGEELADLDGLSLRTVKNVKD